MKVIVVEDGVRAEPIDRPVISIGRAIENDIRIQGTLVRAATAASRPTRRGCG